MNKKEWKGRFENYVILEGQVVGKLFADPTKRWPNGKLVRSSPITAISGDQIETKNSLYTLGEPSRSRSKNNE